MMYHRSGVRFISGIALLASVAAACGGGGGGGLEGRYYNSMTGEFALELEGGKVVMQGQEGFQLFYEVRGDSVMIHDGRGQGLADGMVFVRQSNGDLVFGDLGTLTKNRPD